MERDNIIETTKLIIIKTSNSDFECTSCKTNIAKSTWCRSVNQPYKNYRLYQHINCLMDKYSSIRISRIKTYDVPILNLKQIRTFGKTTTEHPDSKINIEIKLLNMENNVEWKIIDNITKLTLQNTNILPSTAIIDVNLLVLMNTTVYDFPNSISQSKIDTLIIRGNTNTNFPFSKLSELKYLRKLISDIVPSSIPDTLQLLFLNLNDRFKILNMPNNDKLKYLWIDFRKKLSTFKIRCEVINFLTTKFPNLEILIIDYMVVTKVDNKFIINKINKISLF